MSGNSWVGDLLGSLLRHAQPDKRALYRACLNYVHAVNGEANDDPTTNGEQWLQRQLLPKCHTVFDVGANRGTWARAALSVNPSLSIHCFEPSRPTFDALLAQGFPPSVQCNNVGLSSKESDATMFVVEAESPLNSLYRREGLEDGWGLSWSGISEHVKLMRLDDYCDAHEIGAIDYLKLDVEGHELDVLMGARRRLESRSIKCGQLEYGGANIDARVLLRDLFAALEQFGYRLYKLLPDRLLSVPRYDQQLENFSYQNWVFAPTDMPPPCTVEVRG